MKAEPARQLALLDLQALDTRLSQLDHQQDTLPEHAALQRLQAQAQEADAEVVRLQAAHDDVQRELAKADADVQLVRDRAARDRQRLDAGVGSAKDLQGLQHELESLGRRQGVLEEVELEVMERAEGLESELRSARERQAAVAAELAEVTRVRDEAAGRIGAEREQVAAGRTDLVATVGADLVALYEKVRAHSGTGAAPLQQRRCGGCQLELNPVEINRIRTADEDEVLRCEECRRILVRTAESGV